MAHMAYRRFAKTLKDLEDCREHLLDSDLSDSEDLARRLLVELCEIITEERIS